MPTAAKIPFENSSFGICGAACHVAHLSKDLAYGDLHVLRLAVVRLSNDHIRQRLNVTRNTLRTHLEAVHRKLPRGARKLLGNR